MRPFLLFLSALLIAVLPGCDYTDGVTPTPGPTTRFGATQAMGNGTARTYLTLDAEGAPTAVGIVFTAAALQGLPGHDDVNRVLAMPDGAAAAGLPFHHVDFGYHPHGHEPEGLFTVPHFDVHFYMVPQAEQMSWTPDDPDFEAAGQRPPPDRYVPAGYILPPGPAVPMMGNHMIDTSDPTYAPGGPAFGEVFIWGSYDARVVFAEPMFTTAYLEAMAAGTAHTETLAQPQAWATTGLYPTTYSIRRDAATGEFWVELGGLTRRTAS